MTPLETSLIPNEVWLRIGFHERAVRVVEYLEAHPLQRLSLEDAANVAGMERTAFSRFFHQRIGLRFFEFLRAYRVALAMQEMSSHDRSVAEVGFRFGYRCVETFERDFRRVTGMSPSAYRKRRRAELGIRPSHFLE